MEPAPPRRDRPALSHARRRCRCAPGTRQAPAAACPGGRRWRNTRHPAARDCRGARHRDRSPVTAFAMSRHSRAAQAPASRRAPIDSALPPTAIAAPRSVRRARSRPSPLRPSRGNGRRGPAMASGDQAPHPGPTPSPVAEGWPRHPASIRALGQGCAAAARGRPRRPCRCGRRPRHAFRRRSATPGIDATPPLPEDADGMAAADPAASVGPGRPPPSVRPGATQARRRHDHPGPETQGRSATLRWPRRGPRNPRRPGERCRAAPGAVPGRSCSRTRLPGIRRFHKAPGLESALSLPLGRTETMNREEHACETG